MDPRIIDLDLDNPILPNFFNKNQLNNLTLCAGDGKQQGITDIEWFTTNRIGFSRENKPTTIFMTAKNYMPHLVEENKRYLIDNPHLEVLLLVYDDTSLKYRENLCNLFNDSIDNIYEDSACYGKKLNLEILDCILKPFGIYHMEMYRPTILEFIKELYIFEDYKSDFTIDLDNNQIIKNYENTIIANERENHYEFNEAIKTFEERKKLDKADNLKRREYKNINRNPFSKLPIAPNSIYPPPITPNSIYPPPITPNLIYPHPPPIAIQPIRSNSRKGIQHNSNSSSSSRKRKNTSSKSPHNSSSGKRKKSRKSPPKTKKRFN